MLSSMNATINVFSFSSQLMLNSIVTSRWKSKWIQCNMTTKICMHPLYEAIKMTTKGCICPFYGAVKILETINLVAIDIKLEWRFPNSSWWTTQNEKNIRIINDNWNNSYLKIVFSKIKLLYLYTIYKLYSSYILPMKIKHALELILQQTENHMSKTWQDKYKSYHKHI